MTLQTKCLNDVQYSRLIDNTADEVSWWCIMKNTHVTLTTPNIKKFSSQPSTQWVSNYTRHSERGKKARQTEEEVGRQHQGKYGPGVRQVPEGCGEQGKMEETGCEIICGAPTTLKLIFLTLSKILVWHSTAAYLCTNRWQILAQQRTLNFGESVRFVSI